MEHRPSPLAALAAAGAAFVVSLAFGSETFLRRVVFENRSNADVGAILSVMSTPNYQEIGYGAQSGASRFTFLVAFPIVLALLVLGVARGGNAFLAGWASAVAAGAVAGLLRGLMVDDRYFREGGGSLLGGFQLAGQGANYGLMIGWGVGLVALVATLLTRRRPSSADPIGGPTSGPVGPSAGPARSVPPMAWAPTGDRPPPPATPTTTPPSASSWPAPPPGADAVPGSSSTPEPGGGSPGPSTWDRPRHPGSDPAG